MGVQEALGFFEWREAPEAQFAVIGDPISHSRSPAMHNAAYRALGLPHRYVAIRVPLGETSSALDRLRSLGYIGVNVTVPLKTEAIGWLNECDTFASRVRAVNTIRLKDRYGFNTDAEGFMKTLSLLNVDSGWPTLLLGAGGAGRALAAALADDGFPIRIWNRTPGRAQMLIEELDIEAAAWAEPDLLDAKLVVNTTSSLLGGAPIKMDWTNAMAGLIAYEIGYGKRSEFLEQAGVNGIRAVDGLGMLVMQGALAFERWLEVEAPHEAMWEAVR